MRLRLSVSCAATLLGVFTAGSGLVAAEQATQEFRNLRTSDVETQLALTVCYNHSLTCQRLLEEIDSSSTVVYLSRGQCRLGVVGSCLRFSAASPTARYVHVVLDKAVSGSYLINLLAHELQHVVEVARAPEVIDVSSFRSLYQRIGFFLHGAGRQEEWETEEAQRIALVVSKEVKRSQRAALLASK